MTCLWWFIINLFFLYEEDVSSGRFRQQINNANRGIWAVAKISGLLKYYSEALKKEPSQNWYPYLLLPPFIFRSLSFGLPTQLPIVKSCRQRVWGNIKFFMLHTQGAKMLCEYNHFYDLEGKMFLLWLRWKEPKQNTWREIKTFTRKRMLTSDFLRQIGGLNAYKLVFPVTLDCMLVTLPFSRTYLHAFECIGLWRNKALALCVNISFWNSAIKYFFIERVYTRLGHKYAPFPCDPWPTSSKKTFAYSSSLLNKVFQGGKLLHCPTALNRGDKDVMQNGRL